MEYKESLKKLKPYKPGKSTEEMERVYGVKEIIKLGSNENPYGMSKKVIENIENIQSLELYPDNYVSELREKLSEKNNLNKSNFIFGNGSVEILQMICRVLLNEGDNIITGIPSFQSYKSEATLQGAETIEVELENNKFALDKIIENINEKTKIIFIANPNNPTGTIITEKEQEEFIKKVPKNILIVFDEAYNEFVTDKEYPDTINMLKQNKNICILRTFSKAYGLAGLRVGYAMADCEFIQELEKARVPFNINKIAEKSACIALEDTEFLNNCLEKNKEVLNYVYNEFDKLNIEYIKSEANFIMVDVKKSGIEISNKLLEKGIIVRPGFPKMENYLRITIGTKEQMEKVINEIRKIMKEG